MNQVETIITSQFLKNAKIYKLCCLDPKVMEIYIGSTCNKALSTRFINHKSLSKNHPNIKVYKYIYENGGFTNWQIELIETYQCTSKQQLRSREDYWITQLGATLNVRAAISDDIKNKEKQKQYFQNNKEKFKQYNKKYRESHKDQNKEKIKEYNKKYNAETRRLIAAYHERMKNVTNLKNI
mgnify:CR=1 FL=1